MYTMEIWHGNRCEIKMFYDYNEVLKAFVKYAQSNCDACVVTYEHARGRYTVTRSTRTLLEYRKEVK